MQGDHKIDNAVAPSIVPTTSDIIEESRAEGERAPVPAAVLTWGVELELAGAVDPAFAPVLVPVVGAELVAAALGALVPIEVEAESGTV